MPSDIITLSTSGEISKSSLALGAKNILLAEAYEGQKYWGGGGAEYHVAVRPRQGGGCGKGDVLPPTQSTKKILLAYA